MSFSIIYLQVILNSGIYILDIVGAQCSYDRAKYDSKCTDADVTKSASAQINNNWLLIIYCNVREI